MGHKIARISAVRPMAFDYEDYRVLDCGDEMASEYTLAQGDLVFTRYNGARRFVGVCAQFKCYEPRLYPDKLIRTRPDLPQLEPRYLEIALNCGLSRAWLETKIRTTAGQSGVSGGDVKAMPVPLCSLPGQQEIVRLLDEQFEAIERNERELDAALKRSEALRQSILKRAVSGRLVPPACRQAGKTPEEFPQPQPGKWWVYVLLCDDGSFHKGFTDNLPERWQRHLSGHGAQWTAQHPPVELYYWEECWSEASAVARERYLKTEIGREWFQKEVVAKPREYEPASTLLARVRTGRTTASVKPPGRRVSVPSS